MVEATGHPKWLTRLGRHPLIATLGAVVVVAAGVSAVLDVPAKAQSAWTTVFGEEGEASVTSTWPLNRGCDGGTLVAAPQPLDEMASLDAFPDVRLAIIEHGGGGGLSRW